jgi:hypothetical protein
VKEQKEYPHPISGKIGSTLLEQIEAANLRFGVTPGALVRMALESFLPAYLAAQGRQEHIELFAKVTAAIEVRPEVKPEIERIARQAMRKARAA